MCLILFPQLAFGNIVFDVSNLTSGEIHCNEGKSLCISISSLERERNEYSSYRVRLVGDYAFRGFGSIIFQPSQFSRPEETVSSCEIINQPPLEREVCTLIVYMGENRYSFKVIMDNIYKSNLHFLKDS